MRNVYRFEDYPLEDCTVNVPACEVRIIWAELLKLQITTVHGAL